MNETVESNQLVIIKTVAGISVAVAVVCLICYCYVIYLFLKYSAFRRNLFYWLLVHLGATDISILLVYILYGGPKTLGFYVEIPPFLETVFAFVNCAFSFMCIIVVNLIALNRYVAVCWFGHYKNWFSKRNLFISLLVCWFLCICHTVSLQMFCSLRFEICWSLSCDQNKTISLTEEKVNDFVAGGMVLCLIVVYIALFVHYRLIISKLQLTNQEAAQRKRERKLLYQSLIVAGVLFSYYLMFELSSTLFALSNATIARMIFNTLSLLYSGIHPFLYFIFNSELRKNIKNSASQVVPITIQFNSIQIQGTANSVAMH